MHPSVILFGLLSALLTGVADFLAALVSRHLGSFLTLLYMVASSALLLVLAQVLVLRQPLMSWPDMLVTFLLAAAAVAAYLAFYKGLALGPVAVVSPIAACDGAIAALIGVGLIGERLRPGHYAAIGLLVLGVVLAATDLRELRKGLRVPSKGPLLALVPMVGFGIAIAGLLYMADRTRSFVMPVLTIRCCILLQLTAAAAVMRRWYLVGAGPLALAGAVAVGVLDTGGLLALAQGMIEEQSAKVSLMGPLYGAYPVFTVLLSLVFLRERLVLNQWVGVALVIVGTGLMVVT